MKTSIATLLMAVFFIINGCNSDTKKPEVVMESFFDALKNQDFETAKELSTQKSESVLDIINLALNLQFQKIDTTLFDKTKLQFGKPKIIGDTAIIDVTMNNTKASIPFKLQKENGEWKVAFDAETLMKIGIDKMKNNRRKSDQQLDKQLESIQNMPLDSLKDEMLNSLQKLDSVQKTLNN